MALLNQEINRAMMMPDVKEKLVALGLTVVAETPESFAQTLRSGVESFMEKREPRWTGK